MAKEQRPLPLQRGMSSLGKAIERPGRRRAARVLPRAVTDARRGARPRFTGLAASSPGHATHEPPVR